MAEWLETLAASPEYLSSVAGTHVVEGESSCPLTFTHTRGACAHTGASHIHTSGTRAPPHTSSICADTCAVLTHVHFTHKWHMCSHRCAPYISGT